MRLSSSLTSEIPTYITGLIGLTLAFGGLGFVLFFSLVENVPPLRSSEYFGMAIAFGLAIVIVCVGALSFLAIPLTRISISIALLSGTAISFVWLLRKRNRRSYQAGTTDSNVGDRWSSSRNLEPIETLLPICLFFVLLVMRLIQIRNVFVPTWHEGLTHASLLQEFASKSAIPSNSIDPFGFYAIAFAVNSFWRLSPPQTILLVGQWLSGVCGLTFYLIAGRYIRNVYAAGLSFVIYSCTFLFPTQLVSWGHYPYLLGLVLLPPAILTSQDWINDHRANFLVPFVFVTSLGLTHYGLLLVWFSYILVFLIKDIAFRTNFLSTALRQHRITLIRSLVLILSTAIVIFAKLFGYSIVHHSPLRIGFDPSLGLGSAYVYRLFRAHDGFFLILWMIWVLWSVVRQRKLLYITFFWPLTALILIWIQYQAVKSPILTYIDLIVFLSIPLALSMGLLAQKLVQLLIKADSSSTQPLSRYRLKSHLSILLIIAMLVGLFSSPLSTDQSTSLVTDEDMLAMQWISTSTPRDSGFLIRTVSGSDNTLIPSDAGGWITFLTGRRTIIPGMGELYDICNFALEHNVNYVYFGKQRGKDPFDLRLSDLDLDSYTVVYGAPSVEIVSLRCP